MSNHVSPISSKSSPNTTANHNKDEASNTTETEKDNKMRGKFSFTNLIKFDENAEAPKLMLVFAKENDSTCRAIVSAAGQLAMPVTNFTQSKLAIQALAASTDSVPDVIIVDCRAGSSSSVLPYLQSHQSESRTPPRTQTQHTQPQYTDAEAFARHVRSGAVPGGENIVMLAVTRTHSTLSPQVSGSSENCVIPLLKAGFNKRVTDSNNVTMWRNELNTLLHNDLKYAGAISAMNMILSALDSVTDAVEITNFESKIEFVNAAYERLFGYSRDELIGKHVNMVHATHQHQQNAQQQQLNTPQHPDPMTSSGTVWDQISSSLRRGRQWEGSLCSRRKSGNSLHNFSSIIPVLGPSGKLRHMISVRRPISTSFSSSMGGGGVGVGGTGESNSHHNLFGATVGGVGGGGKIKDEDSFTSSGSINGKRKESIARIHAMTIEAPITQVISIINSIQTTSPGNVAADLDRVLEILYTSDLYSAALVKEDIKNDQMTSDLIEGLMSNAKMMAEKSDRKRHQIAGGGAVQHGKVSLPLIKRQPRPSEVYADQIKNLLEVQTSICKPGTVMEVPEDIVDAMENDDEWSFDILQLERITHKKPLAHLAMKVFDRFGVVAFLKSSESVLFNWLQVIEQNYHAENAYHNSTHAADVMQATSYFLELDRIKAIMEPIDEVSCLLAAVIHDLDHPGRNNPFLINSSDKLAILYNDISVLESHHVSLAFYLSQKDERINIYKQMSKEDFKVLRQYIVDLVLATEMAKHFEHLTKFTNNITKPILAQNDELMLDEAATTTGGGGMSELGSIGNASLSSVQLIQNLAGNSENKAVIRRMLIKCSDVNNPTRPLSICKEWTMRIAEEYFAQTDEEKRRELPVVMPVFDRTNCNIPKSQLSFIDFFLKKMMEAWNVFCECTELIENLNSNYAYWTEQSELEHPELVPSSISARPTSSTPKSITPKIPAATAAATTAAAPPAPSSASSNKLPSISINTT